jgi:hypothetical protein
MNKKTREQLRACIAKDLIQGQGQHYPTKERLKRIVSTVSDISVGRADYSIADFVEDIKCHCAREDIVFDNDIFNELVG